MNNNTESDNLSNNAIFNSWNKGLKEGTLDVHGQTHKPKNVYKKISSFDYSNCVKIKDPLKINEDKMKDLVSGKVEKIFVTISGDFNPAIFQLLGDKELKDDPETKIEFDEDDLFFGGYWTKDKNIYMGSVDIIQHQEVSVEWFIEVLKLKKVDEEEWDEDDHSLTGGGVGGYLNWRFEMVAFADEIGLNVDSNGGWTDKEMGLIRHGVSLSYSRGYDDKYPYEIACAVTNHCATGGDFEDDVYFKYKSDVTTKPMYTENQQMTEHDTKDQAHIIQELNKLGIPWGKEELEKYN